MVKGMVMTTMEMMRDQSTERQHNTDTVKHWLFIESYDSLLKVKITVVQSGTGYT